MQQLDLMHALRKLLHRQRVATLGTLDDAAAPFVSMVPFALAPSLGGLVVHVSQLAAHTQHLQARPALSMLVMQAEVHGEPVHALPRVTLAGQARALVRDTPDWQAGRDAYLARFPEAEPMTALGDFQFFAIDIAHGRHIAGFGAARDVDAEEIRSAYAPQPAAQTRIAMAEDADAACEAMRQSIAECCAADHGNDPALLEAWLRNKTPEAVRQIILAPTGCSVVAEAEGRIVGFARASAAGKLVLCYVAPAARFSGAGSAMLAAVQAHVRAAGIETLQLDSTRTALSFYASHGFTEAGPAALIFGMHSQPMHKRIAALPPAEP